MGQIANGQVKRIHVLKAALGMEDGFYRDFLHRAYGVRTSKDLTEAQARNVIAVFEEKLAETRSEASRARREAYEEMGSRPGFASPKQLRYIQALWREYSRTTSESARQHALRTFLERTAKVSDLKFLTQAHAQKVIGILLRKTGGETNTTNGGGQPVRAAH